MRLVSPSPALAVLLLVLALGSANLCHAASADISYVEPDRFTDAGRGVEAERVRDALTRQFQALAAARLPADQSLRVEVLDIDLAGDPNPWLRPASEIRVLKGRADWPRLHLRYTLARGEQVLSQGDTWLSDMDYLQSLPPLRHQDGLPYEQRMLDRWMRGLQAAGSTR